MIARAWGDDFDGNKLFIMTDHLYTPAGMRSVGSSNFKGKDAVITQLLEMAEEKGIDLEWKHGTVSYHEYGYADGDDYYEEYSWEETTDSDMNLILSEYGKVPIYAEDEMIPNDFFENKAPADETFEPTGNEGVNAERQYSNEDAIVIWPRSRRWEVLAGGNVEKMIEYVSEESLESMKEKAPIIAQKVASQCVVCVSKLVPFLVAIGDPEVGLNCLKKFVLSFYANITNSFGRKEFEAILLEGVNKSSYERDPDVAVSYVAKFKSTVMDDESGRNSAMQLASRLIDCMPTSSSSTVPLRHTLTTESIKVFFSMF